MPTADSPVNLVPKKSIFKISILRTVRDLRETAILKVCTHMCVPRGDATMTHHVHLMLVYINLGFIIINILHRYMFTS